MPKVKTEKLEIIRGVAIGIYTVKDAASVLNITTQRVRQIRDKFLKNGESVLIHGNSGKHPAIYRFNEEQKKKIISLKTSPLYLDTNFSNFQKLLFTNEGIEISYTTLINILKEAGISSKMKHNIKKSNFRWRKRRRHFGELLQIGASLHDWFEDNSPCVLHIIIDDATGRLTGLYFCLSECLDGYIAVLRQTFSKHGIPMGICSPIPGLLFEKEKDNSKNAEKYSKTNTSFGELVENKLGIELIDIDTNQGRKCHEVLCNILHKDFSTWLKFNNIVGIKQANKQISHFIDFFNSIYFVTAKSKVSKFEPLSSELNI